MEIVTANSTTRQHDKVIGPTMTIINSNERVSQETDEEGREYTLYTYDQYRLGAGEYELVSIGSLPEGAVWDEQLRSIEREALYEGAEKYISKYRDDAADPDKLTSWIAYKAAVRATVNQQSYPSVVEYPAKPE